MTTPTITAPTTTTPATTPATEPATAPPTAPTRLDLARLRAVRTIITHDHCADGTASAILLHDALPHASVVFVQHGTAALSELPATPGLLFCDIAPPAARVQEFVSAGALVLDHHKTARPVVEAFGPNGVFADEATEPGRSGAMLAFEAWQQLFAPRQIPFYEQALQFATLAGIRDTWQKHHPDWRKACEMSEALRFYDNKDWLAVERAFNPGSALYRMLGLGEILLKKHETAVQATLDKAYRRNVVATKNNNITLVRVVLFEGTRFTSDATELAEDADLIAGFHYEVQDGARKLIFSTRSRGTFDCSALCTSYGGGGHTQAAGFSLTMADKGFHVVQLAPNYDIYIDKNPYDLFLHLLERYIERTP